MNEKPNFKIGAYLLIIGSILAVIVNVLHPRSADINDPSARFQEIADSAIWLPDHMGIVLAVLFLLGGLTGLYRSFEDPRGAAWARLGFVATLVGSITLFVLIGIDGIGMKSLATEWVNAPTESKAIAFGSLQAVNAIRLGLFDLFIILFFGVPFIAFGLAVMMGTGYPTWLGWIALIFGIASLLVGVAQVFTGQTVLLTNILFPLFSVILTLWLLVMGILLLRKA